MLALAKHDASGGASLCGWLVLRKLVGCGIEWTSAACPQPAGCVPPHCTRLVRHFTLEWSPVIDGVDVVGDPRQLAAAGKASNVPVMFGTNRNEGTIFSTCPHDLPNASYVSWMEER